MERKGFTLIELLVVIALIAVLSLILIPSIITVNNSINERLKAQKIDQIVSAAELYGSNNEEIFNGVSEVEVYVYELIESNYLSVDTKLNDDNCVLPSDSTVGKTTKGCMIDPVDKTSMNYNKVILRKENIGVVGTYNGSSEGTGDIGDGSKKIVDEICEGFKNGTFKGQTMDTSGNIISCSCNASYTSLINTNTGNEVDSCLISGDNVNNYLKYGSATANWRVIGLYRYNLNNTGNQLYPKIITSEPI